MAFVIIDKKNTNYEPKPTDKYECHEPGTKLDKRWLYQNKIKHNKRVGENYCILV